MSAWPSTVLNHFNGDPRGYAVYLDLPDGSYSYHLEGTVVSIDRQQKRVIVDGKDIPGFMAAMTMPYPVADDQTLNRVKPGDQITGDVVAAGSDYHLDNVVVVKSAQK